MNNRMAIEGSPWLGQILKYLPNLVNLDIVGNDVDEASSSSVREAFESEEAFTNLTSLKLSHNPIGDKGMQEMAMGLGGICIGKFLFAWKRPAPNAHAQR